MTNGEGPSVPITTLAGIQSLTDLLLELPLPTPLPGVTGHQTLLSHLRDSEEAGRLLNTQESILVPPLVDALCCTTTEHIEVKDGYYGGGSHSGQISQLVKYLVGRNPGLFKGSFHGPQSSTSDHHVPSGQWLQRQCSNISVHPQQHAFSASAVSPCQPRQTQANSPSYYPLEHPPTPQKTRIVQNKTLNEPPKSPVTYSPYAHQVEASGQQHPALSLHHNAISQGTTETLSSGLQENQQIFNSSLVNQHIVNVPQPSPAVHPFSNGNCVDEVDLTSVSAKQTERTENHILNSAQVISNIAPNCSPLISLLNNPNDVSISSQSSSSTPQHTNSSSVIVGPSVPLVNCIKKPAIKQWQSVPNNSLENSQPEIYAKENVNSIHNSIPDSTVQPSTVPGSEPNKDNKVVNQLENKQDNTDIALKPAVISEKRRVPVTEPVVVLSKLSLEDLLLAQKSASQFTIKNRKSGSSPEPPNKISDNRRRSWKKSESTNKLSPSRRNRNSEYHPNRKNSEPIKDKGCKRSLNSSEKINNNTSTDRGRKRRRISSYTNYIESSNSEDEKSDESYREESLSEPVTPSAPKKELRTKKTKKEFASEPLSVEDLMDSNQHFSRTVDAIFDSMDDVSISSPSSSSSSSSSSTPQHTNSSGVIVGPSVPLVNCIKKPAIEQCQSVSNNSLENSQPEFYAKKNVNSIHNSIPDSTVQPSTVPGSEPNKDNKVVNQLENKQNNTDITLKPAVISEKRRVYVTEPVVVLSKLSLEDQLLAQKSVRQFTIKNRKFGSSPEPPNKISDNRRRSWKKSESTKKLSPRRRNRNNEYHSNHKNSDPIKDKGSKRSLNSSEKINNNTSTYRERKRRRISSHTNYIESSNSEDEKSNESYREESPSEPVTPSAPKKKLKTKKTKKELASEPLSVEDLMDSNTYQHFSRTVDAIFDSMEDIDFSTVIDEDTECAAEALIPLAQLQELSNEAAKLKRLYAMNQFPPERLVRLLTILERNIVDGAKLLPVQMMEEQDEEEARLWLELTMERVMRSADASLTALYIMTSPKMPEKVFLEDVIERIVLFLKYQLQNTVFPVFDPAYRLDPKSKDGYAGNIKQKRAHAHKVREKSTLQLYNKLHEAVSLLAELLDLQTLTDTIILQVSTLGVSPFFVEGISELQLNALRLMTTVFSRYDKHRQLILEDILASIARLPTSKRNLRNYRLNSEENIQMLTALVLQLIHSVVRLPEPEIESKSEFPSNEEKPKNLENKEKVYVDKDVLIITSYEASMKTAVSFLSVFLKKCGTKHEEMDYRPLFENFVQDLLSTVNKPEWPASELLLSVLGKILVQNFSNKSMEMTLRVASLDYLGVVAARLRKDAVTSQDRKDMINDVIQRIVTDFDEADASPSKGKKKNKKKPVKRDEAQILQKALLQYLDSNMANDPALQFSRRFYIAQWYRDAAAEIKRSDKSFNFPKEEAEKSDTAQKNKKANRSRTGRRRSSHVNYEEDEEEEEVEEEEKKAKEESKLENYEINARVLALAEERKRFLLTFIKRQEPCKFNVKEEEHIDYKTAELISQYLASTLNFSKSFDLYLSQILRVLSETAVAVRTKAMKCLTLVVEADPSILARPDMQKGVHGRLLDHSTSVREAAVDLLGKFILIRPELISQYYEMLTARILDTGVSVRKRVIKILKDICLEQPDFPKTPEICVKIIRRVNDEDGIKKLVGEVFQSMWFSSVSDKKQDRILQKVKNITQVVEACRDTGLEWFEQLLTNLLKNKEDNNYKSVVKSCKQIVDCLVENLLLLEESSQNVDGGASSHLVACSATLHLFSKTHPPFVVPHATTIQPYLSMKCNTQSDFLLLKNVAKTLELVVPLIEHPSESFLAQIEEDMVKLILRQHMGLLPSCVSCLGSVVNKVTHNYQLVKDCFQKFFVVLLVCKKEYEKNPGNEVLKSMKPKLLRSLYTVSLFCCHFDFDAIDTGYEQNGQISLKDRVFEGIIYFNQYEDENIKLKALTGLGLIMIRHYEFMLGPEVKSLYHYLLTSPIASSILKCQVLKNVTNYLVEEERRMIQKDAEWSKTSKSEDLKEMGDVTSGMASTVIQIYLKQILECVLHTEISVRRASLSVIQLVLGQGLVHPVQIVPYLVCLDSDDDPVIRTKADQLLQEIEKKYPGFIQMKAVFGVRMSYKMQQIIQNPNEILRGFRCPEAPVSRNGFLYSMMRSARQSRRAFLFSLLQLFDEQARTPLTELLYIADNIAYFPYMAQDEPLFIMHQLDIMLSVSGSNLLQTFREVLIPKQSIEGCEQNPVNPEVDDYDDDDDDYDTILGRLPGDTIALQECIIASQACILLLYMKQTLKEMYGFTDNKIQQYSPNETAKVYERPLNRKEHVRFNPETVLNFIKIREFEGELDDKGKGKLVNQYLHFKQLMLTLDPSDDNDDEDNQAKPFTSMMNVTHSFICP